MCESPGTLFNTAPQCLLDITEIERDIVTTLKNLTKHKSNKQAAGNNLSSKGRCCKAAKLSCESWNAAQEE